MSDAETRERIATLESRNTALEKSIDDHETRVRRLERILFGVIVAALLLGWIVSQANSLAKLFN